MCFSVVYGKLCIEIIKGGFDVVTKSEYQRQLTILIISFLAGYLGLDRFYRGEIALGVIKLITVGGFGIWYLVDLAIAAYRLGEAS
jgi:TM2 domain-containing membrane protein YozV